MKTIYASILLLFLIMTGCTRNQKEQTLLPDNLPDNWSAETTMQDLPISTSLLDLLNFPEMEPLVQEALSNNPNLQATAIRLQATGFLLGISHSQLFPKISANIDTGRNNQQSSNSSTGNQIQPSMQISWELDLWGRLADRHAAANFDYKAQAEELRQAQDALAARVIQSVLHVIGRKQIVLLEKKRLKALLHTEATLIRRYRQGLGSLDELATARTRTEVARADLSLVEEEYNQQVRALETILGRYPTADLALGKTLPIVEPPPPFAPATALTNRADIQAALNRVFASEKIDSATKKAMLPSVGISAQTSRSAISLHKLADASTAWSILGSLTQPLFEAGRLRGESRAAFLQTDAAIADLNSIILKALREAEDAFGREQDLAKQERALISAVKESERSRIYFQKRYRSGLDTLLSLLIAREQEMAVKRRLLEVQTSRLSNRIELALALGLCAQPKLPQEKVNPL